MRGLHDAGRGDLGCGGRVPVLVTVELDHPIDVRAVHTDEVLGG
jgi:hypothetical protein